MKTKEIIDMLVDQFFELEGLQNEAAEKKEYAHAYQYQAMKWKIADVADKMGPEAGNEFDRLYKERKGTA